MARKYDFISELYNRTCKTVVANPESWEAFLRSACYNYRLRFDEQLLVHAQRPDATAVLQIDDWNQKFGRWVNRGAHGIAVFEDADQRRQRLVHYFDISDTHPSRFSRRVPIWQMRDEYTAEVIDTLESTFGELNDKETLAVAIESAARNAVEDNIPDYLSDLICGVIDSFLDGVSEEEITHIFKTAVRNSVAYMTMTRLGIDAGDYFEPVDLRDVVIFTTPATLNALGYATSDIAEMGLAEISRTILALDRQNRIIAEKTKADYNVGKEKTERSPDDERDHLHDAGELSAPRSDNAGATGAVDGQVRPDAEEVPEGASQGTLLQPADELRPERASERHGAQSERDGTDADGADGSVGGRDGESEGDGYDELGSEDEQYPEPGAGDRDGGGNLRLDYYDRSHEDKSLPFFGGDDTIREILGTTPHLKASKDEIRAFFEATADENARISYIKRIFNNDYTEVILSDGRRVGYKTYQNVLQLWEGSYLSCMAQSFYDWGVIAQNLEAMRLLGELQDTMKPLPSIDGQLSLMTAGAEERKPSALAFSQEIIDAVLTRGSGVSEGKMRIYEQFQKSLSAKENAVFLKEEYGWGGVYPAIVGADIDEQHDGKGIRISKGIGNDKPHIDLKWSQVEKRIAELIRLDRYLNPKEKAQYPAWLQRQEERRVELAEDRRNREMFETWERGSEKRLTQLFFCDLSTPKNDGSFNVYDDIRQKLIARGVPADEIRFIHEADTEAKKLELFKKVRRGDVRILMGSTQKMGAGTNVQNKLAASSDLDCPWRPSDLEQRLGRSIRQCNENAEVHIYRFVTEETFDAYLYQLVEGKQKFASQIMTSKSPVRSCEDIDETALSYAEIKMLATGNPHIKEKMDLDIQVQKLRLLKSSFLSEKYALEDKIIKFYPQEIARRSDVIAGLKSDMERVAEHPKPSDETFVGLTVKGAFYSEKADAGNAILEACKAMTNPEPIPLGEYRGFTMELYFEAREYKVRLKGELGYPVTLGTDTFGNITRLDNALEGLPKRLEMNEMELDNIKKQFETAKVDVERPFPQEEELKAKTDRLNELNALLNVDKRENEIVGGEPDEGEEPPEKKPRDLER